jgi:chromosome segregation ATPase
MHDYKDRYHTTQKHANQLEQAHEQLTTKIAGYEKLVQRLQDELAKSIKKTQEATGQFTLQSLSRGQLEADLRLQINDLNEKLELQAKYFEQQLQTKVLEYEAKLVTLQKQLDSGSHEL